MAAKHSKPPRKKPRTGPKAKSEIEEVVSFSQSEAKQIRQDLLSWYDAQHRILPWRRNLCSLHQDNSKQETKELLDLPVQEFMYRVWVSETMSQQTQVSRASTYFQRWIEKWPTIQDLAASDMEQVNQIWAGLGYYRRARFLLEGAQYVTTHLKGRLPLTSSELQQIPGIGAYTGSAMASIAAGEQIAAVDANVVRVLSRLRCVSENPQAKATIALYAKLAGSLVDPDRPGDFNQAMMEMGAVLCTGNSQPICAACPIQRHCQAHARLQQYSADGGDLTSPDAPLVTRYPSKVAKVTKHNHHRAVCVVKLLVPPSRAHPTIDILYLLVKRSAKGLLAGLWEFPGQEVETDALEGKRRETVDAYLKQVLGLKFPDGNSLRVREKRHLGLCKHEFSHISCTMHVDLLVLEGQVPYCSSEKLPASKRPEMRWVEESALAAEGLSSRERKVATMLGL